jgi:hypothetical protein
MPKIEIPRAHRAAPHNVGIDLRRAELEDAVADPRFYRVTPIAS